MKFLPYPIAVLLVIFLGLGLRWLQRKRSRVISPETINLGLDVLPVSFLKDWISFEKAISGRSLGDQDAHASVKAALLLTYLLAPAKDINGIAVEEPPYVALLNKLTSPEYAAYVECCLQELQKRGLLVSGLASIGKENAAILLPQVPNACLDDILKETAFSYSRNPFERTNRTMNDESLKMFLNALKYS